MSYASEWKLIKTNFEKATDRKKPSKSFLGVRQATGFEPICKNLDAAVAAKDGNKMMKAAKDFQKKKDEYKTTLEKAAVGGDINLKTEIKVLYGELDLLGKKAAKEASGLDDAGKARNAMEVAWKAIVAEMVKTPFLGNKALGKFVTDKGLGVLYASGAADPRLATEQNAVKGKATAYKAALANLTKVKPGAANAKTFTDALHAAQDLLDLNGGLLHHVGEWSRIQRESLKGADADKLKAFDASPAWKLRNELNEAASAENQRLGILEQSFERQVTRTR